MEQFTLTAALAAWGGGLSAFHGRPAKGILWAALSRGLLGRKFFVACFCPTIVTRAFKA